MADKVKISMFLEPELARAVKMQAASQGAGVSELIGNMFLCAHCGEAITDDFVVGLPKLVAPNKYRALFHTNRPECLAASGAKVVYLPVCPTCKLPAHQQFEQRELYRLLQHKGVKFYCIRCDNHWAATHEQSIELSRLL
jgi:hypothetical protein